MNRSASQNKLLEKYLNESIRRASSGASLNQAFICTEREQQTLPGAPAEARARPSAERFLSSTARLQEAK